MDKPIFGKIALVTGGGHSQVNQGGAGKDHAPSIGSAIAQKLASMGAVVAVTDISAEAAEKTLTTLQTYEGNPSHTALRMDVTDEKGIRGAVGEIVRQYGGLDIVCNNAGVSSMAYIEDLTESDWDFNVDINMKGVFLCTKAVVPYLKQRGGRIVNTCSMAAIKAAPILTHYTASKFGVLGFTKASAIELAPHKITVNCVCPGWVKTPMQDREVVWEGKLRNMTPEAVRQDYIDHTPLGRLCYPEDVANAVGFFVLPASDFITGQEINVAGGANIV